MTPPRVAILLATFNGAAYLDAQITSLLWQHGVDVHIFARDDGSTDATPALLAGWKRRHSDRFTLVDTAASSTGSANGNFFLLLRSIDLTPYSFLAFADQDDVWTPAKLARAVQCLASSNADGYSSDLIAYDRARNAAWMLRKAGQPAEYDYLFQGASAGCTYVLTQRAGLIAADVVKAAPPFCADASHDWILYAICRSRGLKWVRDEGAEIVYRQHDANQYGARRGLREGIAKLKRLRSSWYRDHICWLRHVIAGHRAELRILDALARGRLADRWWLIRNARRFRRTPGFVFRLRLAIALGMV